MSKANRIILTVQSYCFFRKKAIPFPQLVKAFPTACTSAKSAGLIKATRSECNCVFEPQFVMRTTCKKQLGNR